MDKLEIGTEVIGFEFPHHFYNNRKLCFNSSMNNCIGEIGEIIGYDKKANTYSIKFRHELGNWWYPAELIEPYVVKNKKRYSEEEVIKLMKQAEIDKIKAQIEVLENVDGEHYHRRSIYQVIKELQTKLKELEDDN